MCVSNEKNGEVISFDGAVSSICTYTSICSGDTIWVGECDYGFLYGVVRSGDLWPQSHLSVCLRYARKDMSIQELKTKGLLIIDREAPIPPSFLPSIALICRTLQSRYMQGDEKVVDLELN